MKITALILFTVVSSSLLTPRREKLPKHSWMPYEKLVTIPAGNYIYQGSTLQMHTYYMSMTEVTNGQYMEFINDMAARGDQSLMNEIRVDSSQWKLPHQYSEPVLAFPDLYHRHPAYRDYPVVNISRKAAELFCSWLTEKYNTHPSKKTGKLRFRLPTEQEWCYAAQAGNHDNVFAWTGPYERNHYGAFMANFTRISQSNIRYDSTGQLVYKGEISSGNHYIYEDSKDYTTPVISYWPNAWGLYNMSGNVAEMVNTGSARGGSWHTPLYYLQVLVPDPRGYGDQPNPYTGFRVVAEPMP